MNWKWGMKDEIPAEALSAKPFETPKDYKHPTLGEQFRYALKRHPYHRYGYAVALGTGALMYYFLPAKAEEGKGPDANTLHQ